eukprot:TRINITY_DN7061_c0_g1_i15.p1 TRINITY_DN7061_c0_g1~~TRINITY_DN7061_c0_g1_i15.p1  ORF type:complete len:409 (-),score=77.94 TRINITY_DN7061_c0_g1_i15:370-1596(-)
MSEVYEVVVYTAALSLYANPILDQLDPCRYIQHRLFRDSCLLSNERKNGRIVKDLSRLGRDLNGVIIVDNSPACYSLQPENGIPISTWTEDLSDMKLTQLAPLLRALATVEDVRSYLMWLVTDDNIDYVDALEELEEDLRNRNEDGEASLDEDEDSDKTLESVKDCSELSTAESNTFGKVRKSLNSSDNELRRIKEKLNLKSDQFEILSVSILTCEPGANKAKKNLALHPMYSNISKKSYELTNRSTLSLKNSKKEIASRLDSEQKTTAEKAKQLSKYANRHKEAIIKHISKIKGVMANTNELYKYSRMNHTKKSTQMITTLNQKKHNTSLSTKSAQLADLPSTKAMPSGALTLRHSHTQGRTLQTAGEGAKKEARYSLLKGRPANRVPSRTPGIFICINLTLTALTI